MLQCLIFRKWTVISYSLCLRMQWELLSISQVSSSPNTCSELRANHVVHCFSQCLSSHHVLKFPICIITSVSEAHLLCIMIAWIVCSQVTLWLSHLELFSFPKSWRLVLMWIRCCGHVSPFSCTHIPRNNQSYETIFIVLITLITTVIKATWKATELESI